MLTWDDSSADPPRVGYEVPFYADHADAGDLARKGALSQGEIDLFQDLLADVLLERVHAPAEGHPLSVHLISVVEHALHALEADPELARLVRAESIRLNGEPQAGPRKAFARALEDGTVIAALDAEPQVRLHGDLFLENILWRPAEVVRAPAADPADPADPAARRAAAPPHATEPSISPRLLLIDPVSVAGVVRGPPIFDLVKYESYATGELPALRSEWVDVRGFDGEPDYSNQIRWQSAQLAPFRTFDWHTRFRRAFEAKYGPVDSRAYRLIDGYFSVAMAVNTGGTQRRARLLKATQDFNAAGAGHPGVT
ncbi:MAG TPA: hypothetical protein VFH68_03545 [Polyangia bacterium]|nr:hypothetical protein [Polyangia bacterium]